MTRFHRLLRAVIEQDGDAFLALSPEFPHTPAHADEPTPAQLVGYAFILACQRRYRSPTDLENRIIMTVASSRASLRPEDDFDQRVGEALIYGALGIEHPWVIQTIESIDDDTLVEVQGYLLVRMVEDLNMSAQDVDTFVDEAVAAARSVS